MVVLNLVDTTLGFILEVWSDETVIREPIKRIFVSQNSFNEALQVTCSVDTIITPRQSWLLDGDSAYPGLQEDGTFLRGEDMVLCR